MELEEENILLTKEIIVDEHQIEELMKVLETKHQDVLSKSSHGKEPRKVLTNTPLRVNVNNTELLAIEEILSSSSSSNMKLLRDTQDHRDAKRFRLTENNEVIKSLKANML